MQFRRRVIVLSVAACFGATGVWALPTGPQVVAGSATFNQSGNALTIGNTPGAIINWNAFSIGAMESVRFQQQNSLSSVLNRVTGGDLSRILGELTSNGRVFLLNPNGILFGAGSRVDVAGLIASTLDMRDQDFLAGKLDFKAGAVAGGIQNAGSLQANAGNIYLIAPDIENSGIVRAPSGEVLLAAGRQVSLVDAAHPDIQVVVSAPDDKVVNLGELIAGRISVFGALLQHKGLAKADRAEVDDHGRIVFRATSRLDVEAGSLTTANGADGGSITLQAAEGDTYVSGTVEARGSEGQGGTIAALGQRVAVSGNARLDASGEAGGGRIMVGGDFQGKNAEIQNARVTYFGPDAVLKADAGKVGDGGTVIVWADGTARAYGTISAQGGAEGGNGGFVETSGKHYLEVTRAPNVKAHDGLGGTWLLDPDDIVVQNSGSMFTLVGGSDGTVNFAESSGGLTIDPLSLDMYGGSVILQANNNITFTDPLTLNTYGASLNAEAGNSILVNAAITTYGGAIGLTANTGGSASGIGTVTVNAALDTTWTGGEPAGANITLSAPSSNPPGPAISINSNLNAGTLGDIYLTAGSATQGIIEGAGGTITGDLLTITAGGPVSLTQTGNKFAALAATLTGGTGSTLDIGKSVAGPLNINSLSSSGAVTIDMAGQLTQSAAINAPSLDVSTAGMITLTSENNVGEITLAQTSTSGGQIQFNASGGLNINGVTNSTTQASLGDIFINATGAIDLKGNISTADTDPGAIVSLSTRSLSGIVRTSGTITGNTIELQTALNGTGVGTGPIGATGGPILTSTIGGSGSATITLGNAADPVNGVYLSHTGDINLSGSSSFATNMPVSLTATGNLSIPDSATINTGTANLELGADGLLTLTSGPATGASLSGTNVTLKTNRLNIDTSNTYGGTISAGGTVWILPSTNGWNVNLGSAVDNTANTLELSPNELNQITAGTLRVGSTLAGGLNVSAAIAPANTTTLSLEAGGNITQTGGAISETNLALKSLGDVILDTQTNSVANVVAQLGDASNPNRNLSLKNGATALNVGSGIDSVSGISIYATGTYNSALPDGAIALTSGSGLTQSAGALLAGKAVYAEGARVNLNQLNPTGVIAGKATGGATGDTFVYQSSNGISVSTVDGWAGIATAAPPDATTILLTAGAAGISQEAGAVIDAGTGTRGLGLSTSGAVNLTDTGNTVGAIATGASNPSAFNFYNNGSLTIGIGASGITTNNGSVSVGTGVGGTLNVQGNISAGTGMVTLGGGNVVLGTNGGAGTTIYGGNIRIYANAGGTLSSNTSTTANSITATAGEMELEADTFNFTGVSPELNAPTAIFYHTATDNANLSVSGFASATHDTPWLEIGNEVVADPDTTGNLSVNAALSNPTGAIVLLAGNGISQTAGSTITASELAFKAGTVNAAGTVSLGQSNLVSTVAGATNGGTIVFNNAQSLYVGTVTDGTLTATGLSSGNGTITLSTSAGSIDLVSPISAGTGNVSVTASAGSINDGNGSGQDVAGGYIGLVAGNGGIGSLADPIETQTVSLFASKTAGTGDIGIANSGNLSVTISGSNGSNVSLSNAGSITTASSGITSGGGNATVQASGGDITVVAQSYISGNGSTTVQSSGAVNVNGGSIYASSISGDTSVTAATDINVSGSGAYGGVIWAGRDVYLTATSGKLFLTSNGTYAKIEANFPQTVYLDVPGQTSGGYVIDGVAGGATTSGSSGIFVMGSPAVLDSNFFVTYATPTAVPTVYTVDTILSSGTASHTYGQSPTAVFGYSLTTTVQSGESVSGSPVFTPTVSSLTPAGSFTVYYDSGLISSIGSTFVPGAGLTYTVNPAVLVITATLTGEVSKVYDGNLLASLAPGNFLLTGFINNDGAAVNKTISGTYAIKNVGSGILVSANLSAGDYSPTGTTNLANYVLPTSVSGNIGKITKAPLTLTGLTADKVYDGNTLATLKGTLGGVITGDDVSFAATSATFDDRHVGTGKTVTVTGLTLGGNDVGNYELGASASTLSASITQRPSVTWIGGPSGAWSLADNWEDGALPDFGNVASVIIPSGTVAFDGLTADLTSLSGGTLQLQAGTLNIGSMTTGSYQQEGGTLNVGSMTTGSYQQSGGTLSGGGLTVTESFSKSGGSMVLSGLLSINQASGNLSFSNDHPLLLGTTSAPNGFISIVNTGLLRVGTVTARDGVSLRANSPLQVDGPITTGGNISLTAGSTSGAGDDLTINGTLTSSGGSVSLYAGDNLTQNANVSTSGGSVSATAETGSIAMAGGTTTSTGGGSIGYAAPGGNIQLATLNAGSGGSLSLAAGGSITSAGQSGPNLIGGTAQLSAGGDAVLTTNVFAIGGTVGGSLSINNNGTLITNVPETPVTTDTDATTDEQISCLVDPTTCGTDTTSATANDVINNVQQTQQTIVSTSTTTTSTTSTTTTTSSSTSSTSSQQSSSSSSSDSSSDSTQNGDDKKKQQSASQSTTTTTPTQDTANAKPNYCN